MRLLRSVKEKQKRILLIAVFLGVLSAVVRAQVNTGDRPVRPPYVGAISGQILLPSGRPASGSIQVTLSSDRTPMMTAFTNERGEFRFNDLGEGTYFIRVAVEGDAYEPLTQEIMFSRSSMSKMIFYLREKSATGSKKPGGGTVSAVDLDVKAPADAKKEYGKATKLIEKGDSQKAIECLSRAIAIYPDYLTARNELGVQYLKLKRLTEAVEQFETVIQRNPKHFNARFNLGLVYIEEKDYKNAVEQLSEAVAIDSARPDAHMFFGVAFLQTGDLDGAARELSKTLTLGGQQYAIAHYYLAHVYLRQGGRDMAKAQLEAYLKDSPSGDRAVEVKSMLDKLK
jgi:Tfp pilus assembly protein PilF